MLTRFDYNRINEYQLEITSYCNAACPQCPRNMNGSGINPLMPLMHLPFDVIKQAFQPDHIKTLRQIFFCGSYGDPIMNPEFLEILQYFRQHNEKIWLYIHTNGGVHDATYWAKIAQIIGKQGKIDFGIDGLSDTNHVYRQNVDFAKVIENATSFIDNGGIAQWNFIVFKHNEHQVSDAKLLSEKLGFCNFNARSTGRFLNHSTVTETKLWPIYKRGVHIGDLEPTTTTEYQNNSIKLLPQLKEQYNDIADYFDTTPITCDALLGSKVAITAEGLVLPCNFFNHNLYDIRFHDRETMPGSNELSFVNGKNQVAEFIDRYGKDKLNVRNYSLVEIFNNPFWDDLVATWNEKISNGRIFECAMTCGQKFKKVWDQSKDNIKR